MKTIYKSGTVDAITDSVAAELTGCTFIIYCTDDKRFAEISSKLHERMPDAQMIGTTGFMFNESGSFAEGISAVGFTGSEVEVRTGVIPHVDTCPIKHLAEFTASVDAIRHRYKDSICFEFSTGYEEKVVSTLKISLEPSGMRLVGGTPGNTTPDSPKQTACNGEVFHDACVYAVIGSKLGKIKIFKENLFQRENITHNITRVSADGRTIYEIDGRKAMDVYEEELGYNSSTVQEGVFRSPFARIVGAEPSSVSMRIGAFPPIRTASETT